MTFTTSFRLLDLPTPDLDRPRFDPKAPLPKEPVARFKAIKVHKFLLADGRRAKAGEVLTLPRSEALDLAARGLGVMLDA